MSAALSIAGAILLSVVANDAWALSAPLARRMVLLAARMWARDAEQAATLSEEWRAYIDDRPGQILKLCTASAFLAAAFGRLIGHKLQARRRRVKQDLGGPSWIASIDFAAAQANAVAVGLLVGLISSFAPLVGYAAGLDLQWAVIGWGVGLSIAVIAIITSVGFGFFVARQQPLPRDAEGLDRLARILNTPLAAAEPLTATYIPLLVRPFVVHRGRPHHGNPAETDLVRPYIKRTGSSPTDT
jgi:hypothetical protein